MASEFIAKKGLVSSGSITSTGDIATNQVLKSNQSNGSEGGEIFLNKPAASTTITDGVVIDVYQDKVRIFEAGGTNRGGYFDLSTMPSGVATNLSPYGYTGNIVIPTSPPVTLVVENGLIQSYF